MQPLLSWVEKYYSILYANLVQIAQLYSKVSVTQRPIGVSLTFKIHTLRIQWTREVFHIFPQGPQVLMVASGSEIPFSLNCPVPGSFPHRPCAGPPLQSIYTCVHLRPFLFSA